jgi:predicted nucleotidyltransferase
MGDGTLAMQPRHLEELRRLIAAHLPNEEVWAYGSRVAGTAHETSDLDLVVRHPADLHARQGAAFRELEEAIRESNLPVLIELLDWACLPPSFWENIVAQHVVLHKPGVLGKFSQSAKSV